MNSRRASRRWLSPVIGRRSALVALFAAGVLMAPIAGSGALSPTTTAGTGTTTGDAPATVPPPATASTAVPASTVATTSSPVTTTSGANDSTGSSANSGEPAPVPGGPEEDVLFGPPCDPNFPEECPQDRDGDGVGDLSDNCINTPNSDQANSDGDHLGNACDNCPYTTNADQANTYGDERGDACEPPPPPPPPPNNAPNRPTEEASPSGDVTSNQSGPFRVKYSDPDGHSGSMTYTIYRFSDNSAVQTVTATGITSGETRNVWLASPLASGHYYWKAVASDGNLNSPESEPREFLVNLHPPVPVLESPLGTAAAPLDVPIAHPVLRAASVDAEGDSVGFEFKVTTDPSCSTLVAGASSPGFLPLTNTWAVPTGVLKDGNTYYWCARAEDYVGRTDGSSNESAWSAVGGIRIRVPKLGLREQWPLWSHGPLAVNQATGNLVLSLPGPSYPFATGSMAVSATYNSKAAATVDRGLGSRWTLDAGDAFAAVPAKLIDHSKLTGSDKFDAFERVSGDGSSDYYSQVGSSGTYLGAAGDGSMLTRNASDGSLSLLDPDGTLYVFGASSTAEHTLISAEFVDADPGKTKAFYCITNGRLSSIRDTACGTTPTRTLNLIWNAVDAGNCTAAILCIQGPDSVTWKYIGDAGGGTSGRLLRIHNGTRNIVELTYGANGLPLKLRDANDLNPPTGHDPTHSIQIGYDGSERVASVSNGPITGQTPATSVWSFNYFGSVQTAPTSAAHGALAAGTTRTAEGMTELTPPRQQGLGAAAKTVKTYYDNLARTIQVTDQLLNTTLYGYDDRDLLLWSEDEGGNPTDHTWGNLAGGSVLSEWISAVLLSTATPDPDGAGAAARPVTRYRYDETRAPASTGTLTITGDAVTDRTRAGGDFDDGRLPSGHGVAKTPNLMANPSLESNTSGWGIWQGTLERTDALAHAGSWSGKAIAGATGGYSAYYGHPLSGNTRGRTFTVSAWLYVPAGSSLVGQPFSTTARATGGASAREDSWNDSTLQSGWQRVTSTLTIAQPDRTTMEIQVYVSWNAAYTVGDYFHIDDAEFREHERDAAPIDSSIGIWEQSTNFAHHGSFERSNGNWYGWQSTLGRTETTARFGAEALEVARVTGSSYTASTSTYPTGPTAGRTYTASAWVRGIGSSIGKTGQITVREDGGATAYQDTHMSVTLTDEWQRIHVTRTFAQNDRTSARLLVWQLGAVAGDKFLVDGAQLEERATPTSFIRTFGADATRNAATVEAPADRLSPTQGWLATRVRVGFDLQAQDVPVFAWGTSGNGFRLYWRNGQWDARRHNGSSGTQLLVPDTLAFEQAVTLVLAWNPGEIKLSVDGAPFQVLANSQVPTGLPAAFQLGSETGSTKRVNSAFLWTATGTGVLFDANAAAIDAFTDEVQGPWAWPTGSDPTLLWTADTATFSLPNATPGPRLQGLQAWYYDNADLVGRPAKRQTDATVDFDWGAGGPAALAGRADNFSVRWSGELEVTAQANYIFSITGGDNYRLLVDKQVAIDAWTGTSPATSTSHEIELKPGLHRLILQYKETTGNAAVKLRWRCNSCTPVGPDAVVPASLLYPGWQNQTSTVAPSGRWSFQHLADPTSGRPDYTLARGLDGRDVVTSFEYDAYGRPTRKVMPKGNAVRTIDAAGVLTGTADGRFATNYSYYGPGETATPPATCGGGAAHQAQLLKSSAQYGLAPITIVYDAAGRAVVKTAGVGTTCSTYNPDGTLASALAPGDAAPTTFAYSPTGQVYATTRGSETASSTYDETGRVKTRFDSFGAEARLTYDAEGNVVSHRAATGAFGSHTVYDAVLTHDVSGRLTQLTDPAGRAYRFFYDRRGNLKATQYPNNTFSWNEIDVAGRIAAIYHRHGSLASTLPAVPPADSSPLAEYNYTYDLDGRTTSEARTGGGLTSDTTRYLYDARGRLEQFGSPHGYGTYRYDLNSNRTASVTNGRVVESYLYDPSTSAGVDQLTRKSTAGGLTSFGYDSDGRTILRGSDAISWDGWDRHTGGTFAGETVAYDFDATGFRRARSGGGATRRYLLGGLFETTASGAVLLTEVDTPAGDLAHYAGPPTPGVPVAFLYYNGHGDVGVTADDSGARVDAHSYEPFGSVRGTVSSTSPVERWTARADKKLDVSSGLVEMGARPYDPATGRFYSVDPVDGGSCNNYDFACQDPVNGYDLDGRDHTGPYCSTLRAIFGGCAQRTAQYRKYREEPGSSRRLAKSMGPRPDGHAAHHIIAANDRRASIARDILAHHKISINAAQNGVYLPRSVHQRIHTNVYYRGLTTALQRARSRDDVFDVLDSFRTSLKLLDRPR